MKILITPRELIDQYLWDEACEMTGLNRWVINEGQMASDDEITLTEDQAARLGLKIRLADPDTTTPKEQDRP